MVKTKVKFKYIFILLTAFLLILNTTLIRSNTNNIYDQASLFTSDEKSDLENQAKAVSDQYNMDVVIATVDNTSNKSSQVYADDFYEDNNIGRNNSSDGILLLIDLDNREVYISTSGAAIKYLSDQRLDNIINQVLENGMADQDYYRASVKFLKSTSDYLSKGVITKASGTLKVKGIKALTPLKGIVSLVSGSLASVLYFFNNKSRYKMEKPNKYNNFRKNSQVSFINKEDRFIKTETLEKAVENIESSKTTTHTSTSGKVHGGKGRKF